jgi:hypothetical protein
VTAFEDLPGRFEITASTEGAYLGPRGPLVALLVEQVFEDDPVDPEGPPRARRPYRAGIATLTIEHLDDLSSTPGALETFLEAELGHVFRPWTLPDSAFACSWPTLIPFPKIHVLERLARSSRARRCAWLDARYLAARRVRKLADLVEGDQDLPQRRRGSR